MVNWTAFLYMTLCFYAEVGGAERGLPSDSCWGISALVCSPADAEVLWCCRGERTWCDSWFMGSSALVRMSFSGEAKPPSLGFAFWGWVGEAEVVTALGSAALKVAGWFSAVHHCFCCCRHQWELSAYWMSSYITSLIILLFTSSSLSPKQLLMTMLIST